MCASSPARRGAGSTSEPAIRGTRPAGSVRRDPGDILALEVRPFYRLARTLAVQAGLQHWTRKADQVSYAITRRRAPWCRRSVLAEATAANATLFSAGITYSNPGRLRAGGTGLPVDASWSYERVLRSAKGRVPDTHRVRAQLQDVFRALVGAQGRQQTC